MRVDEIAREGSVVREDMYSKEKLSNQGQGLIRRISLKTFISLITGRTVRKHETETGTKCVQINLHERITMRGQ